MDFLYMLNKKLDFVRFVYQNASKGFQEEIRKIDEHETPYDNFNPEAAYPPFIDEYLKFGDGIRALGNHALSSLSVVLQEYLAAIADQRQLGTPPKEKGKGIFPRYAKLFQEKAAIDLTKLGADCALIEELFMARNVIQHAGDLGTNWVYQDKNYARKFPKAEFANRSWIEPLGDEVNATVQVAPLEITPEKIEAATEEVRKLCTAIDKTL